MTLEEFLTNLVATIVNWATNTGIKIVIALIVMFISFKIINAVGKKIAKIGEKKNADKTIMNVLVYAFKLVLKCLVTVCLIGYLGIDTSAITALIASLGVCIGLAVNGTLSNLAGGVLILITRPFKVDDFIEAQGVSGTVSDIRITSTKIITPDNKVIYVPNGTLANGNIINYSEKETRRVDIDFCISYASDAEKAKDIITEICEKHELVLKDPAVFVRVGAHSTSGLQIKARAWVNGADYWTVFFDLTEAVKAEFDKNGIEIPFNHLDVHIKNK